MLTKDQMTQFSTTGYIVVENVLDGETLAAIHAEYGAVMDRLYANWETAFDLPTGEGLDFWGKLLAAYQAGCDWFQSMDISLPGDKIYADTPFHFGPAVFDMLRHPRLLDIVAQLIGPEITSNPIQHVRIKPPAKALHGTETRAHITATDWHQDRAVALETADQTQMVTVWLAITDATVENGCLQVLPGKVDMLPHCPKQQTAIADGFLDAGRAMPLPVKAGGAVIFHPLTPHSSLVNQTDGFRWSFDLRYHVTGQDSGRSHFPEFILRSQARPDTALTDWQDWAALWHGARARLAIAPHTPIHRWQAGSPACA